MRGTISSLNAKACTMANAIKWLPSRPWALTTNKEGLSGPKVSTSKHFFGNGKSDSWDEVAPEMVVEIMIAILVIKM